jgi:hypothetical protein
MERRPREVNRIMREHPIGTPEPVSENRAVSLEAFHSLARQYSDFCKKLRFLIKGAFTAREEVLALEIAAEFLDGKEKELEALIERVSEEAQRRDPGSEAVEVLIGRSLMQHEDYHVLQQIAEIRKAGGPRWETLQSILADEPPPGPEDR